MKKFICLLLAVLMLAACLSACSGDGKKTVDTVKKAGQLVMATSPDFPPFEELQSDGTVAGIEIDVDDVRKKIDLLNEEDPVFLHGSCQLVQCFFIKILSWLILVRDEFRLRPSGRAGRQV